MQEVIKVTDVLMASHLEKNCAMPTYNLVRLLSHLTHLYTGRIQMLAKTSGVSSPHKNMEKKFIPLLCLQHLIFKVQPNVLTLIFYIFICGDTQKP